jgi:hypothetical protein
MGEGPPKLPIENAPSRPSSEKAAVESGEKISPRLMEGSFYFTKIAHMLLPQYVPDIDKAAEGEHTFKREGVAYQIPENDGDDVENKEEAPETGKEIVTISNELEKLGLTTRVDAHYGSYVGEGKGGVKYVKTLAPWEVVSSVPGKIDLLFDEKSLRSTIRRKKSLSPEDKKACEESLNRVLELFEEEKVEQEKIRKENLRDSQEGIKEIENILAQYEGTPLLDTLMAITTEEQAVQSAERQKAISDRNLVDEKLQKLQLETSVTEEEYGQLHARYKALQRAIGARNSGLVDHTR